MIRINPMRRISPVSLASDTVFSPPARGIVVGTAGSVEVQLVDMPAAEVTNSLPPGVYPMDILRLNIAGTTATNISVWW